MFAAEPPPSAYDLHFMLGRVPVRVHPLFWLMSVFLIANSRPTAASLLLWMLAVFVSILVHEMGHALAFAFYGIGSHIVLYSFGGLAVPEAGYGGYGSYSRVHRDSQTHEAQMIISFAGPLAGFLLAGAIVSLVYVSGHFVEFSSPLTFLNFALGDPDRPLHSRHLQLFVWFMLDVNILWGVINLLPVYPLDGGQLSRALLSKFHPRDGLRQSLVLSVFTAAGIALLAAVRWQSLFMALMFGYLAYNSYLMLQHLGGGGFGGGRGW